MKQLTITFASIIGIIALSSCSNDNIETLKANANKNPIVCSDSANFTYSKNIKAIITTNCAFDSECHVNGGNAPGDLSDYNTLKSYIDNGEFKSRVIDQTGSVMPPAYSKGPKKIADCDMQKLKNWIAAGAANN